MPSKIDTILKHLNSLQEIELSAKSITAYQFKNIVEPFYKWIIQLQMLHTLNFSANIYNPSNSNTKVHIILHEYSKPRTNTEENIIYIPSYVKNIEINSGLLSYTTKIKVQNPDSLIINNEQYNDILNLITNNKINNNLEIYKRLEKIGISLLKQYKKSEKETITRLKDQYKILKNNLAKMINIEQQAEMQLQIMLDQLELVKLYSLCTKHTTLLNHTIQTPDYTSILEDLRTMKKIAGESECIQITGELTPAYKTASNNVYTKLTNYLNTLINS